MDTFSELRVSNSGNGNKKGWRSYHTTVSRDWYVLTIRNDVKEKSLNPISQV